MLRAVYRDSLLLCNKSQLNSPFLSFPPLNSSPLFFFKLYPLHSSSPPLSCSLLSRLSSLFSNPILSRSLHFCCLHDSRPFPFLFLFCVCVCLCVCVCVCVRACVRVRV